MSSELLLDVEGALDPSSSRSQLPFAFDLPEGAGSLVIELSYSPVFLLDLRRERSLLAEAALLYGLSEAEARSRSGRRLSNLLTLSLDDPLGFRGCAHRRLARRRILVSEAEATPGFVPGPLPAGRWKATVSVHLVVTDRCEYRLKAIAR